MCKKIFIAATGQNCGKTTTSLSLLHLARKKYKKLDSSSRLVLNERNIKGNMLMLMPH